MEPRTTGPVRPCGGRRPRSRLWLGLLLTGLGALVALASYGVVDLDPLWRCWPLLLVLWGLRVTLRTRGRHVGGLVLLLLGIWFLLRGFDLIPLDDRLIPAAILVIVGVSFVLSTLAPRGEPGCRGPGAGGAAGGPAGAGNLVRSTAVLGAVSRASAAQDFRGGSAFAFLGSCDIDLRQAAIAGGEAVLEASAFWGGVHIYVPATWAVAIEGSALLGGFRNDTRPPADASQRLVVTGLALMGAVEVRNERDPGR